MTSIQQLKKDKKEKLKKQQDESLDASILLHRKQKSSIQAISDTPGFKTIKDFWILQSKQAEKDLKNVRFSDMQEFGRVQAKANLSDKFISFLDNLEK